MKAIRVEQFGEPEVMKLMEVPQPKPGPGQVLVRVQAVGVNPVETYIRAGTYARKPALPFTPGNDGAGVVEEVGPPLPNELAKFQPGDRVYTAGSISGTYAECTLCHAAQVHPLPANASFAQGAALYDPATKEGARTPHAPTRGTEKRPWKEARRAAPDGARASAVLSSEENSRFSRGTEPMRRKCCFVPVT